MSWDAAGPPHGPVGIPWPYRLTDPGIAAEGGGWAEEPAATCDGKLSFTEGKGALDGQTTCSSCSEGASPQDEEEGYQDELLNPTTVMITKLAPHYTQTKLVKELRSLGYDGCYNFIYFPLLFGTRQNKGRAFVNFLDHATAWRFVMGTPQSKKRQWCFAWAHTQGYEANVRFAESSRFRHVHATRLKPLVLGEGERDGPQQ